MAEFANRGAAEGQLATLEVDIFHAQAETFHQSEPGAVQQGSHEPVFPLEAPQYGLRLGTCEDGGEARGTAGPLDVSQLGQV